MKKFYFKFVNQTKNRKLGLGMAATYTSSNSCPITCPYLTSCYAQTGHVKKAWLDVDNNKHAINFKQLQMEFKRHSFYFPNGFIRVNTAGDLPGTKEQLSAHYINGYIKASKNLKVYTYTHYPLDVGNNIQLIKRATNKGFTINKSCETINQVKQCIKNKIYSVLTVPSTETRKQFNIKDNNNKTIARAILCKAQLTNTNIDCATCQLCYDRPKNLVIYFKSHGNGKKKLDKILDDLNK